jgi:hypothetical protein
MDCDLVQRGVHDIIIITRVDLKIMPPILLCWLATLEADAGGMTVEVKLSRQ